MRRHLPLLAYKHAYVVTEPIPGLEGLPSIRDYNAAVYMKTSGEALHIGGYELDPIRLKTQSGWDMEDDFAFGLCKTPTPPSSEILLYIHNDPQKTKSHKPREAQIMRRRFRKNLVFDLTRPARTYSQL